MDWRAQSAGSGVGVGGGGDTSAGLLAERIASGDGLDAIIRGNMVVSLPSVTLRPVCSPQSFLSQHIVTYIHPCWNNNNKSLTCFPLASCRPNKQSEGR